MTTDKHREYMDRADWAESNPHAAALIHASLSGIKHPDNLFAHNVADDEPHPATHGMEDEA